MFELLETDLFRVIETNLTNCKAKFFINLEKYYFGLYIDKKYMNEKDNIIKNVLEDEKDRIKYIFNEWKNNNIEKVVTYGVVNKIIIQIKRLYSLDIGEIKACKTDFGINIYVDPYTKDKDILDNIMASLQRG